MNKLPSLDKLGAIKKEVPFYTENDKHLIESCYLFLKHRSELDRLRLRKAFINYFYVCNDAQKEILSDKIIELLSNLTRNFPAINTIKILGTCIKHGRLELGIDIKYKDPEPKVKKVK